LERCGFVFQQEVDVLKELLWLVSAYFYGVVLETGDLLSQDEAVTYLPDNFAITISQVK
jgi:hypothetical protein